MDRKPLLKLLILNLLSISFFCHGQNWDRLHSIDLPLKPISCSTDIQNNLYIGFQNGKMIKYAPDGTELQNYALSNLSSITLVEAQNSFKIFLFLFDNQEITILDRFSTVPKTYLLTEIGVELGMMSCPSPDGSFWVVENNPQRLSKIDPLRQSRLIEVQTQLGDSISYMRAYQNLLLISDENELHIFDQFGSRLNSIENMSPSFFQFNGENILALDKKVIYEIDPFKASINNTMEAPTETALGVFQLDEVYAFITETEIIFYKLTP